MRKKFFLIVLVILCGAAGVWTAAASDQDNSGLRVHFLDVGQGDATLIETPSGKNILIDGGPDKKVIRGISEELDYWDRELDLVILTHPHTDHVTGLNSVLDRFSVKKLLVSPSAAEIPAYKSLLQTSRNKNIPTRKVIAPLQVKAGPECDLNILHPTSPAKDPDNLNNISLVSRLVCSDSSFLFTGDIEEKVEKRILEKETKVGSDVLKVSHHGSDDSNIPNFLQKVSPKIAVISVGADNELGHPSRRVIKRLQRTGTFILRTDKDGGITIVPKEDKWKISSGK